MLVLSSLAFCTWFLSGTYRSGGHELVKVTVLMSNALCFVHNRYSGKAEEFKTSGFETQQNERGNLFF